MSAVLVLTQRERISLFADAACYSADGVLQAVRSKITTGERPACAIAVRGHRAVAEPHPSWTAPDTFDALVAALPELVDLLATAARTESPDVDAMAEVIAVGWSESRCAFEGWGAANVRAGGRQGVATLDGYQPGETIRLPATWGAPGWDPALARGFGERWRGVPREAIDPECFGVDALTAARVSAQWETPAGEPITGAIVGGFVEMAQVTRAGVSLRVLGSWPDRIGDQIARRTPFAAAVQESDARRIFLRREYIKPQAGMRQLSTA